MKTAIIIVVFFALWLVSLPCTVLVIIFQMAKDNADWLYTHSSKEMKDQPEPKRQSFQDKLAQRMKDNPPPARAKT